jgi:CubicO group peptidase (beta-lactamase class C family)
MKTDGRISRLSWIAGVSLAAVTLVTGALPGISASASPSPISISLDAAAETAATLPRLHSLLVSWRGELVLERYFNGARPTRPANIKSASKSVISALVGIAIERGLIESVEQPISTFFPRLLENEAAAPKRDITIEDLLTMRSGLESTSNRNYGAWVQSPNWVEYALDSNLSRPPGLMMDYSTGNTHLLSAILTKVSGKSTWEFAQEELAAPLGFQLPRWPRDPQGIYFGGNDMEMTPRQMVAFGELYLRKGRANGRQVIPAEWVSSSLTPRTQSRRDSRRSYGYCWWSRELGGQPAFYAWGYGGQYIFLVPNLDLVVVTTSSTAVDRSRGNHNRMVLDLVERLVIGTIDPAVEQSAQAQ